MPTDDVTALDLWTLVIAVLAAITGIAALVSQIYSHVASGPRVKVAVANALLTSNGAWALSVDVTNVGRLPVTILEVGLILDDDHSKKVPIHAMHPAMRVGPDVPSRLIDGDAVAWYVEPADVATKIVANHWRHDVRGYVRLATGKRLISDNRIDVVNLAQIATRS
jgi:hypothetical protein